MKQTKVHIARIIGNKVQTSKVSAKMYTVADGNVKSVRVTLKCLEV